MKTFGAVLLAATAACAVTAAPAIPSLPKDWTAIVESTLMANEGGTISGNTMCCDTTAMGACEVQYESQAAMQYFDYTNKRVKLSNGAGLGGVMYDYNAMKAYQVTAKGDCQSYCPIQQGQQMDPLSVSQGSKDTSYVGSAVGNKLCDGQSPCDEWKAVTTLFGIIPMATTWSYVYDPQGADPILISQFQQITPFGKPGPNVTTQYAQFKAGTPDPAQFVVNGNATCQINQQCQQQSSGNSAMFYGQPQGLVMPEVDAMLARSDVPMVADLALRKPHVAPNTLGGGVPNFPQDWTAIVEEVQVIGQGDTHTETQACCPTTGMGQCKVQYQRAAMRRYFDVTDQLMKNAAPDGSGAVFNFTAEKAYIVAANGTCQYSCPLPPQQGQPQGIYPIGMDPNSTDVGSAVGSPLCAGQTPCELWEYVNKIPILNITMEIDAWYVGEQNGKPSPLAYQQQLTPLGENLGNMSTIFHNFEAGKPAASVFHVPNAASCPVNENKCNGN